LDADLRIGRRLETGRRSESYKYILNELKYDLFRTGLVIIPRTTSVQVSAICEMFITIIVKL